MITIAKSLQTGFLAAITAIALTGAVYGSPVACTIAGATLSTACLTVAGNNDSLTSMNAGSGVFGNTDWLLADKSDANSPSIPSVNLTFTGAGMLTGTWSVGAFGGYTKAVLVVKGASVAWVAYFLDLSNLSGTWSTAGIVNKGGNQPDMSHLSRYVADFAVTPPPPPPPPVVPLPAGAPLLLGGLAVLAALRRRKRAA